jgi:hypothetical protein
MNLIEKQRVPLSNLPIPADNWPTQIVKVQLPLDIMPTVISCPQGTNCAFPLLKKRNAHKSFQGAEPFPFGFASKIRLFLDSNSKSKIV